MVKKYLSIFVFLALIFACKAPAARNVEGEPAVYTQAYVDKHFPAWDVGVAGFEKENDKLTVSIAEKRFIVEALATIRVFVNTPEFEAKVLNWSKPMLANSTHLSQVPGGQWNVTDPKQHLDKARVLDTMKRIGYDLWIHKRDYNLFWNSASYDAMVYAQMDLVDDYKIGSKIWLYNPTGGWTHFPGEHVLLDALLHEASHNLGYQHGDRASSDNAPFALGLIMRHLLDAGLKQKYATEIKKMQEFYLNKYKSAIEAEAVLPESGHEGNWRIVQPRRSK